MVSSFLKDFSLFIPLNSPIRTFSIAWTGQEGLFSPGFFSRSEATVWISRILFVWIIVCSDVRGQGEGW